MVQKAQLPIWESIRLIILGSTPIKIWSVVNFLANLTNFNNVLSGNLGKTSMYSLTNLDGLRQISQDI